MTASTKNELRRTPLFPIWALIGGATVLIGSGLAGAAGAALAPIKTVSPPMGFPYAVDSFMVLVLGGVGSLWGVVAGSALIGEGESILSFIYNNVIGKMLVFVMIVAAIRVWPRGLFGYQERR